MLLNDRPNLSHWLSQDEALTGTKHLIMLHSKSKIEICKFGVNTMCQWIYFYVVSTAAISFIEESCNDYLKLELSEHPDARMRLISNTALPLLIRERQSAYL